MTKPLLPVWVAGLAVLAWYAVTHPWLVAIGAVALLAVLVAAVRQLRRNPRPDPEPEHLTHA